MGLHIDICVFFISKMFSLSSMSGLKFHIRFFIHSAGYNVAHHGFFSLKCVATQICQSGDFAEFMGKFWAFKY